MKPINSASAVLGAIIFMIEYQVRCVTVKEECPKFELYYPEDSANLNDKCNYTFYRKYGLPYLKAKLKKKDWETAVDLQALSCDNYMFNASSLICNSESSDGLHSQQPLQCDPKTNTCQCLVIKELGLKTMQPMGTSGCMGAEDSFCDDIQIYCGFGFSCIKSKCKSLAVNNKHKTIRILVIAFLANYLASKSLY